MAAQMLPAAEAISRTTSPTVAERMAATRPFKHSWVMREEEEGEVAMVRMKITVRAENVESIFAGKQRDGFEAGGRIRNEREREDLGGKRSALSSVPVLMDGIRTRDTCVFLRLSPRHKQYYH